MLYLIYFRRRKLRKAVEVAGVTYIAIDLKTMERTEEQRQTEAVALSDQFTK
jgi:hypothetical protein